MHKVVVLVITDLWVSNWTGLNQVILFYHMAVIEVAGGLVWRAHYNFTHVFGSDRWKGEFSWNWSAFRCHLQLGGFRVLGLTT